MGSENNKKTKRLAAEEQLMSSLINNEMIEIEELKEEADRVKKPNDAAYIIKQYEEILRTKRKGIISVAYHQGRVFRRFHEKEMFVRLVANFKIHKNAMISKSMFSSSLKSILN